MFAFNHDTLKERFHVLAMEKMHIYGIYILDVIFVTSSFCFDEINIGRHDYFNYLPPKIKFGIFGLKLANTLQESHDRDRLQWP